jgi:hypothetical protein
MSHGAQPDYDALAKKYGAVSSRPDYDALAKQHGAISSTPPEQPGYFKRLGQSLGIPTSTEEFEQALTPVTVHGIPIAPRASGLGTALSYGENVYDKAKELIQHPDAESAMRAVMSLTPAGGSQQSFGEDVANKNYTGAAGTATGVAAQAVAPAVIDAVGRTGSMPNRVVRTAGLTAKGMASDIPIVRQALKLGKNWQSTAPETPPVQNAPLPQPPPTAPVSNVPPFLQKVQATPAPNTVPPFLQSKAALGRAVEAAMPEAAGYESYPPQPGQPMVNRELPEGHIPVNSAKVASYMYDEAAQEMHVRYTSGGPTYVYRGVEPEEVQYFQEAKSQGKALQAIEAAHPYDKIINGKRIQGRAATQSEE